MSYVLAKERDVDVMAAFANHRAYLRENKKSFPPSAYGDTAFTVPLFDGFMKRIMPVLH
jgi:hypothetical protein